ncbi:MAG: MBL fold metallo-hydrolase [Deltaproteobacteria bacterium]|nr:MBL fold metallo-hydrolase [Deltaproteobacteria bacterium]MBW2487795.1 MBL fold metallo-hydrolase [Deltaproteobacteria bacterium]MBW2518280.1 MBL fold metallo-hydrolase [Deltaproteobacteria bacterium]
MATVVKSATIQIERFELGPFGTNSYILSCLKTGGSVVIDAPGDAPKIIDRLHATNPKYILMTHNHMDHTGALAQLKSALNVPLGAHAADAERLPIPAEMLLADDDTIRFGNIRLVVMHTPGHTPGSLCFYTEGFLISGDTLFPDGPGKTGSPSSFRQIVQSLQNKIFVLPDDTQVFPGHGDHTVLGKEKRAFEAFAARPHDPNLCGDVLWTM